MPGGSSSLREMGYCIPRPGCFREYHDKAWIDISIASPRQTFRAYRLRMVLHPRPAPQEGRHA